MMTDKPEDSQQYWYIPVPQNKFSQPKFHLGQQVSLHWEDEFGNPCYDIGEIVGMEYVAEDNQPAQWYYRMRLLKSERSPWMVGLYDENFKSESRFLADDTVIED
jgi:hypothetical protein